MCSREIERFVWSPLLEAEWVDDAATNLLTVLNLSLLVTEVKLIPVSVVANVLVDLEDL
jgi:hypothetical protein